MLSASRVELVSVRAFRVTADAAGLDRAFRQTAGTLPLLSTGDTLTVLKETSHYGELCSRTVVRWVLEGPSGRRSVHTRKLALAFAALVGETS